MLHDTLVKIFATKVGISVRRDHFENTIVDRQQRHIEGSTTQIVNEDVLLRLLVESVGNSSCSRLVNNPQHVQTSNDSSILRRLSLCIVEVRWNCHHCVLHLLSQVVLSSLFHLCQHHG
mmetsp:Transcript_38877/g.85122  ORF Transcript_38877/g.85122 Transcript_38877/m.85122 type:complete len:119 (-) Transcript_38877:489-845(-)